MWNVYDECGEAQKNKNMCEEPREEEEGEAGSEQEKQEPHLKNTWLLAQFGVHRSDLVGDLCRSVVLLLETSAGRELETTG